VQHLFCFFFYSEVVFDSQHQHVLTKRRFQQYSSDKVWKSLHDISFVFSRIFYQAPAWKVQISIVYLLTLPPIK
jgi:hypothetical protein